MNKEKYLVLLSEGEIEKEIIQSVEDQGYMLNDKSGYCGSYTYKFTKNKKAKLKVV